MKFFERITNSLFVYLRKKSFLKVILYIVIILMIGIRFLGLEIMPLFADEAAYMQMSDQVFGQSGALLVSLKAAVLPILPWILALLHLLLGSVGSIGLNRAILVLVDVMSAFLIFKIVKSQLGSIASLISIVFYLSFPMNFLHGRLIMLEPLMNFFFLSFLYIVGRELNNNHVLVGRRIKQILIAGILLALAYLTKPLVLVTIPGGLIFLLVSSRKKSNELKIRSNWLLQSLVIAFVLVLPLSIMVLSKFDSYIPDFSFRNLIPLYQHFKTNLWKAYWWVMPYFTLPVFGSLLIGSLLVIRKKLFGLVFIIWIATILTIEGVMGTFYFPRHLFPLLVPVSIWIGFVYSSVLPRWKYRDIILAVFVVLLILPLWKTNILLLTAPKSAEITLEDRQQFFRDWTSGVGLEDLAMYIKSVNPTPVVIVDENDWHMSWTMSTYYLPKNIQVYPLAMDETEMFLTDSKITQNSNVLIILNRMLSLSSKKVKQLFEYTRPEGRIIRVYSYIGNK